jgi:hypothetical protein
VELYLAVMLPLLGVALLCAFIAFLLTPQKKRVTNAEFLKEKKGDEYAELFESVRYTQRLKRQKAQGTTASPDYYLRCDKCGGFNPHKARYCRRCGWKRV